MRKFFSLIMLVATCCICSAQPLSQADAALVYYMPFTTIALDVTYVQTEAVQGPFYQYAERYLGTKEVVTESATTYSLQGISIQSKTDADRNRAYKFVPSKKQPADLNLTGKGILKAYNAEITADKTDKKATPAKKEKTEDAVQPYSEETLLATSKAKMAESTAKQIYRIREARMNILAGEVEHLPADGQAMKLTLAELDKQEKALVALFVGTTKTCVLHHTIYYQPNDNVADSCLFRFSRHAGPVAADDLSGEPIYLNVEVKKQTLEESDAKPAAASQLYYNLPGEATIMLNDGEQTISERTIAVAQFGVAIPLPLDLIGRHPHIIFDTKTGAILSIQE